MHGVEPRAPAAAPHTVVTLGEIGERVPRRGCERPDREGVVHEFALGHGGSLTPRDAHAVARKGWVRHPGPVRGTSLGERPGPAFGNVPRADDSIPALSLGRQYVVK